MSSIDKPITLPAHPHEPLQSTGFPDALADALSGIVLIAPDRRLISANPAFCKMVGYSERELIELGVRSITHPDDLNLMADVLRKLYQRQIQSASLIKRYLHRDGHMVWALAHVTLQRDSQGEPLYSVMQLQDITDHHDAVEALQHSEAEHRALLNALPDLIFHVTHTGTFLAYHGSNNADLIMPPDQLVGQSVHDVLPKRLADGCLAAIDRTLRLGETQIFEFPFERAGSDRYYEARVISIDSDRALIVVRNIAQRKQAEMNERDQRSLAEALRDTASALNSTLNFDEILELILTNAGRVVPHDAANIMLINQDQHLAYVARQQGYDKLEIERWLTEMTFNIDQTPNLSQMVATGQPYMVSDTQADPNWVAYPQTQWLRSYACVPIRINQQVIGFLNLDSATPGFFVSRDIERLQAFADQIAVAIHNVRLYEATQRHVQQLTRLNEASIDLARTTTLSELYQRIAQWAVSLVEARASALAIFDDKQHLTFTAVQDLPLRLVGQRVALGQGAVGQAAQKRQPLQVKNLIDLHGRLADDLRQVKGVIALPMLWQDRLIGVIVIADQREREFDRDQLNVLTLFTALAAGAIEQQRALNAARARESEARLLTHRLTSAQEEERQRIAALLHDTLGQQLVTLQDRAELALSELSQESEAAKRLQINLEMLRHARQIALSLAADLNSRLLIDLGLAPAMRQHIDWLVEATGLPIHLHITGRIHRLPADVERTAFRVLQESITNAVRHAKPTQISVRLHVGAKFIRLSIEDDGQGFNVDRRQPGTQLSLPDLQRQVEALNGEFILTSSPGQSTRVMIRLPFRAAWPSATAQTRVLIVEDHNLARQGLRQLLTTTTEFVCVGEAANSAEAQRQIELVQPDLILMAVQLPGLNGIATTRQILRRFPHMHVVFLTYHDDEIYLEEAMQAGAQGYVLKSDDNATLLAALHTVLTDSVAISPQLLEAWQRIQERPLAASPLDLLTDREREVVQLVAVGHSNRSIASKLGISVRTVEDHRHNALDKLDLKNGQQLIQFVLKHKLI